MSTHARTVEEMRFAAGLTPCPTCGSRDTGELALRGSGTVWALSGPCPSCGTPRERSFTTTGDPLATKSISNELGAGPSELITGAQFSAELARLRPAIVHEPERLAPGPWKESRAAVWRALIAANELIKLASTPALVKERDALLALVERYKRDGDRVWKLQPKDPSRGKLDPGSLTAHVGWLQAGRTGAGRLELEHVDLTNVIVGPQQLTGAKLVGVKLVQASLRHSTLDDAHLCEVDASGANFESASLRGAWIERGTYVGARMGLCDLDDIKIDGADLSRVGFDRSLWKRGAISDSALAGTSFANARLDGVAFRRCDLQKTSFASPDKAPEPTTRGTTFEDCDLRDTSWAGRDLSGATFVRCKLAGARGAPRATEGLVVTDCDVTRDALVAQLR